MRHYKHWPMLDELPAGWSFSKAAGSPLHGYAFAMSGSPLRGGKTALVRVLKPQMQLLFSEPASKETAQKLPNDAQAAPSSKVFFYDQGQARTVNELARQKFKRQLLQDILLDLTICEIEGWCKSEYINELRSLINGIGQQVCIDA